MADNDYDSILSKVNELVDGHKNLTRDELSKIKRDLTDAIADAKKSSHDEVEELRTALEELNEWVDDEKRSRSEKDKVRRSKTTLVVPPNDTAIIPPEPLEQEDETMEPNGTPPKRGGFFGWW